MLFSFLPRMGTDFHRLNFYPCIRYAEGNPLTKSVADVLAVRIVAGFKSNSVVE